jgi:GH25 family lysozyme M1 (1,4-beta-N-acetylmuramidase)
MMTKAKRRLWGSLLSLAVAGVAVGALGLPPASSAAAPSGFTTTGIDVSNNQGTINWSGVAGRANFSYAKATEGTGYVDPYFPGNNGGAKDNGIYAGAYSFGRPDEGNPKGQADFLVDHADFQNDGLTLPPMLDIEWPYFGGDSCYGLSASSMVSWIRAFVDEVKARTGRTAMIYTNTNWWNPCTGSNGGFGANPLFIANYSGSPTPLPAGWSHYTLWQYSDGGSLPGDQDVFNGAPADLTALAHGADAATLTDVNGDGRPDLIARNPDGTLVVYPHNATTTIGTGSWALSTTVGTGWQEMTALLAADVDGDGRPDLIARTPAGNLVVYPHNATDTIGTGMWHAPATTVGTGWASKTALLVGDVNGDGRPDLIARNPDGTLVVYPHNATSTIGTGTWAGAVSVGTGWQGKEALLLGDVDGDGRPEIVARDADGTLVVYPHNATTAIGTGTWHAPATSVGTGWQGKDALLLGDVDGDGTLDIIARNAGTGVLVVYPHNPTTAIGTGTWHAPATTVGTGWGAKTAIR